MQVEVVAGTTPPLVRLALTRAEVDAVVDGRSLRFEVELPEGRRRVQLMRADAEVVGEAPDVRLRIPVAAMDGVIVGATLTPLFSDVPFSLELRLMASESPAAAQARIAAAAAQRAASPPPVQPAAPEDPMTAVWGSIGGGAFMILMGAVRAALSTRRNGSSTNTAMMVIGGAILVYGLFRWLTMSSKK